MRTGGLLDLVPQWFRTRWPLRRFYWQEGELAEAEERAQWMGVSLGEVSDGADTSGERVEGGVGSGDPV